MVKLIVTEKPELLQPEIDDVPIISPSDYINLNDHDEQNHTKVINLCSKYQYQNMGYHVSLLAEARGHKVIPETSTITDLKVSAIIKNDAEELDNKLQQELAKIAEDEFELMIYFGFTVDTNLSKIGLLLFNLAQAPVLKATFTRKNEWQLNALKPVSLDELSAEEGREMVHSLRYFLSGRKVVRRHPDLKKFDLAIMVNPDDPTPPSDPKALQNFIKAAEMEGFNAEIITKNDFGKITQFDALFIRETTAVNHHTYRFAQKAEYEGLAVIDDPNSILKCANKVYLKELMTTYEIPMPKSQLMKQGDADDPSNDFEFPLMLKLPDRSNSTGAIKVDNELELENRLRDLFQFTDIIIVQEFMPSGYNWRVGILNGEPLYVIKSYKTNNYGQTLDWETENINRSGKSEIIALREAPSELIDLAIKTCGLIGNGLYVIDIKELDGEFYIIEINDNPSIESEIEDRIDQSQLYHKIMNHLMNLVVNK